jgi:hypothetical protein
MTSKIKSDALFQELKRLIEIPANVRKLVLTVEINEPVVVAFDCLASEPKEPAE